VRTREVAVSIIHSFEIVKIEKERGHAGTVAARAADLVKEKLSQVASLWSFVRSSVCDSRSASPMRTALASAEATVAPTHQASGLRLLERMEYRTPSSAPKILSPQTRGTATMN